MKFRKFSTPVAGGIIDIFSSLHNGNISPWWVVEFVSDRYKIYCHYTNVVQFVLTVHSKHQPIMGVFPHSRLLQRHEPRAAVQQGFSISINTLLNREFTTPEEDIHEVININWIESHARQDIAVYLCNTVRLTFPETSQIEPVGMEWHFEWNQLTWFAWPMI